MHFRCVATCAGFLALLFPETLGEKLPDTLEEAKRSVTGNSLPGGNEEVRGEGGDSPKELRKKVWETDRELNSRIGRVGKARVEMERRHQAKESRQRGREMPKRAMIVG